MKKPKTVDDLISQVPKIIKKLEQIDGVKVYDFDKKTGNFRIMMYVPPNKPPIFFNVESKGWEATLESKKVPEITPPSYLQVEKILTSCDYNVDNSY
jgi:hypothetical protein